MPSAARRGCSGVGCVQGAPGSLLQECGALVGTASLTTVPTLVLGPERKRRRGGRWPRGRGSWLTRPLSWPASHTPCAPAGRERLALRKAAGLPWKFHSGPEPREGVHARQGGHAVLHVTVGTKRPRCTAEGGSLSGPKLGECVGPHAACTPADLLSTGTGAVRTTPPAAELA